MKVNLLGCICILFVLLAIVSCESGTQKHHKSVRKLQKAKEHNLLSRAKLNQKQGQCKLVCEGVEPPPGKNVTKYPDGSWSYLIQVDSNFSIHVGYNKPSDFLAIFNPHLNLTWITNGKFIGVFNMTSEFLMLIDTAKNIFNIFPNVSVGILNGSIDIMILFEKQFNVIVQNSVKLVANLAFQVDGFLKSLRDRTLGGFFHGNVTIFNAFNVNFGFYMNGSINLDGFNTFLQPIVGVGKFSFQILSSIEASIEYGTNLTMGTVNYIFVGLGRVTVEIQKSLEALIKGTVNSSFSIGRGLINGLFKLPGSLYNVISGTIHVDGGVGFHISSGINKQNGFLINVGNETGNYSVNYNATLNTLGFYNGELDVLITADGSTGMFMIFNAITSAALIVNATGYAKLILDVQISSDDNNLDIGSRFALFAKFLKDNEKINEDDDMSFDLKAYLKAYLAGNVKDFFEEGSKLEVALNDNFGGLFKLAFAGNGAELYAKFGVSMMFNVVYGENVIGLNFAQLIDMIYAENAGRFSVKLMKKVYASVQSNIKAGGKGFKSYIFKGLVKACVGGAFHLNGLSGSVGFSSKC